MTEFTGTPVVSPATTDPQVAQVYCSINDLLLDPQPPAGSVAQLYKLIKAASRTILQEIGEFIPVTETRKCTGTGRDSLYIPPMLAIVGDVYNDEIVLQTTDYILHPGQRFWRNGPYNKLVMNPEATNLSGWSCEVDGVVIPARWGLYEETADTGATLAEAQADVDVTLEVDDGSKLSPGAVILTESEQQLIDGYELPTTAVTTLDGAIDATQEVIVVADSSTVNIGEIIRIDVEKMRILDISGDTLFVQRRWDNTISDDHADAAAVDVYRTFTVTRGVNGTTAENHNSAVAVSRYLVPDDVLYLCKEIATLMAMKAAASYAGRTGNQELGTVFYNDAFPRFDLERVRDHYSIKTMR